MTLSVLQTVYKNDSPLFFDQSLKSIYCQTLRPDKVILIKDGTLTAELESVIEKWKGKLPLEIHGYEENRGLASALNYGIDFADTDLTARMDSDDICLPERFEKQTEAFAGDPGLFILGSAINEFSEERNFLRTRFYEKSITKKSRSLYKGTPLAHPSLMIKTELLKKYRYNCSVKNNEDIDLWFRILKDGHEIKNLQEPLLNFRITEASFRRRSIKKGIAEFFVYKKYLHLFNGFNIRVFYLYMRLLLRFLPSFMIRICYFSPLRFSFFRKK